MEKRYVGIDHHKKFSQVCATDEVGQVLWEGSLDNTREAWLSLRSRLGQEAFCISVLEAGRNWGVLYDLLEELDFHPKLANPLKVRMIADSFIKTDAVDARALVLLLRAGIIPEVYVLPKEIRDQKNLLRHRLFLVREQTRLKNRIHNILDRNHLEPPEVSDLFGARGRRWMEGVSLPPLDRQLLSSDLRLLDHIRSEIREADGQVERVVQPHPLTVVLRSLPGFGHLLSALAALEIHTVDRFPAQGKLLSYSGLVVSTYSSAHRTVHGRLLPACNRHLRYAFIEAAWTAVRTSAYFVAYHKRLRRRLNKQEAILQVARRLCEIAYRCLKERRPYEERPYRFGSGRLHPTLA